MSNPSDEKGGGNFHPLDEIPLEIDLFLKNISEYRKSLIGSYHYFIKVEQGCISLWRTIYAGSKMYFSEQVNHQRCGISDTEIEEAVNLNYLNLLSADYLHISPRIEMKLRAYFDLSR
jgi:hypothetical protein